MSLYGPAPFFKNSSMERAFWYSSTSTSWVLQVCRGRGKITGSLLAANVLSNVSKFRPSFLKSNWPCIICPKTSTSSGSDNHCTPGTHVSVCAKNDMIRRSRRIVLSTRGCRILIATAFVGTTGGGCRIAGVNGTAGERDCRFGVRCEGGMRSCFRVALYTYSKE